MASLSRREAAGQRAVGAPGGEVHLEPVLLLPAEEGGELVQHRPRAVGPHGLHAPQGGQKAAALLGGEHRLVEDELLGKPDAASLAPLGVDGDARLGQGVHVPVDGAARDFEVLSQLVRRHAPAVQQQVNQLEQPG